MGEKVINSTQGKPREFVIPADKRTKDQKDVTLILPDSEDPGRYVIVKKDIPGEAKTKRSDIKWINNFGVKFQGEFVASIDYQIVADAPPKGNTYFYFDGANVKRFAAEDMDSSGRRYPGKWVLTMHSGDPAVGMGGG